MCNYQFFVEALSWYGFVQFLRVDRAIKDSEWYVPNQSFPCNSKMTPCIIWSACHPLSTYDFRHSQPTRRKLILYSYPDEWLTLDFSSSPSLDQSHMCSCCQMNFSFYPLGRKKYYQSVWNKKSQLSKNLKYLFSAYICVRQCWGRKKVGGGS